MVLERENVWQQHLNDIGVIRLWPNLPLFPQSTPSRQDLEGQRSLIGAEPLLVSTYGRDVTWAIIDSEINREHSVIFTLPVIVLDDAQTPDQRCRYTWHNAGLTSGCS